MIIVGLIIVLLLILIILLVYKRRQLIYDSNTVYSPAYGRVLNIANLPNDQLAISIFLSPLDGHDQYIPFSGTVTNIVRDDTGQYNTAYDLKKSKNNTKVITEIATQYGSMYVYQIAGFLARHITNDLKLGQNVKVGNYMGTIHFGSQVDLIIPNSSKFQLNIKKDDYLNGRESIIGKYIT